MKRFKLSESGARGWFIGDFPEAVHRTQDFEVNFQNNRKGVFPTHYHKVVTEIQLVIRGLMRVNGELFGPGDIVVLEPGDVGECECLEDTETVAIKFPSRPDDKYYV
jgi:quercetin dioxygenase-like cupin family protein